MPFELPSLFAIDDFPPPPHPSPLSLDGREADSILAELNNDNPDIFHWIGDFGGLDRDIDEATSEWFADTNTSFASPPVALSESALFAEITPKLEEPSLTAPVVQAPRPSAAGANRRLKAPTIPPPMPAVVTAAVQSSPSPRAPLASLSVPRVCNGGIAARSLRVEKKSRASPMMTAEEKRRAEHKCNRARAKLRLEEKRRLARQRRLNARRESHYPERRVAAQERNRVGGRFKKEKHLTFVSVSELQKA